MELKAEVKDFLTTRRARITPESVGLVAGGNRRVPGLRRSEVAQLAGLSVEYYSRLERGDLRGVSDQVLEALGGALQLDLAERDHLADLARQSGPSTRRGSRRAASPRPILQDMLDAITGAPAFITNPQQDMVADNFLAQALYSELYRSPARPVNHSRFIFLDPASRNLYPHWESAADVNTAILRTETGRHPGDKALAQLIGELSMASDEFRVRWARHEVRRHDSGSKVFAHQAVGPMELCFEAMDLPGDVGLRLTIYTAPHGSPAEESLRLLGSWAASQPQELRAVSQG